MGYLTNFIVYTLAMIGVIFIALMVFKSTSGISSKKTSKFLKVHDTLSLGGRKTLYIVSAGEEKFLIAGDIDKTSLISKLETKEKNIETNVITKSFKETMSEIPIEKNYIDKSNLGIHSINKKPYSSVMKNLAERIKQWLRVQRTNDQKIKI